MNTKQIEFIKSIMQVKINGTNIKNITPACLKLSKTIDVSHLTLMKAAKGQFSMRTVIKMIQAQWFTLDEFLGSSSSSDTSSPSKIKYTKYNLPDTSIFEKVFKKLIEESFDRGYKKGIASYTKQKKQYTSWFQEGYQAGFQDGKAEISIGTKQRQEAYKNGYKEGFDKGRKTGQQEGYSQGFKAGSSITRSKTKTINVTNMNTEKLNSLLRLYSADSAPPGEKFAAQRAVGVMFSNWIKKEFGHEFQFHKENII